jgi:hypothetical protein
MRVDSVEEFCRLSRETALGRKPQDQGTPVDHGAFASPSCQPWYEMYIHKVRATRYLEQ